MAAAAGDLVHVPGRAIRLRHERVDERRLADARVAHEHGGAPGERRADLREWFGAGPGTEDGNVEGRELREKGLRVGDIRFRDDEQRGDARVVGGDEVAIDESHPRLGVRGGHHDEHLVGVRDHHALELVGVVGASAQQGAPILEADDAGEGALRAGGVADELRPIADHDGGVAQLPGARRDDLPLGIGARGDEHLVAPTIHPRHHADHRVGVLGTALRARPVRLRVRALPHDRVGVLAVGLVVAVVGGQPAHWPPSMPRHSSANCGSVFAVLSMSSTSTPGTRRPTSAPVVAMR